MKLYLTTHIIILELAKLCSWRKVEVVLLQKLYLTSKISFSLFHAVDARRNGGDEIVTKLNQGGCLFRQHRNELLCRTLHFHRNGPTEMQ